MALKRTELKRSKIARVQRKNKLKRERRETRKLEQLKKRSRYKIACEMVDIRDGGCCQECGSPNPEHHHIQFKSALGKDDPENIVSLCGWCHRYSPKSPHQSREGRLKWVDWATKRYSVYWKEIRDANKIMPHMSRERQTSNNQSMCRV